MKSMKLLLDECVPRRVRRVFPGYEVFTIEQAGFKGLKNGTLIAAAAGVYDVLITVDKNVEHQQNKKDLPIAILILSAPTNRFDSLSPLVPRAIKALEAIKIGEIVRIDT